MSETLKLGLIGTGRIGRVHSANITRRVHGATLAAVADINLEAAERCALDQGIPDVYGDHRRILERPDIEAVLVCTSTDAHVRIVEDAAEAGKHIFCEKPLDFDLSRIDGALKAVESAGVKLQIGFNRRFDPSFRRAREMVSDGTIGEPQLLRITSRDPEPPQLSYVKISGGIFMDMTIHDWDMARFLVGDEIEDIYATGSALIDPRIGRVGDIDTAVATLRFRGGTLGSIDNSRRAVYGYDQRVELMGSRGVVVVSNRPTVSASVTDASGLRCSLPPFFFVERYMDAYAAEIDAFVSCVETDTRPLVTGHDGRVAVAMGCAAARSLKQRRPVTLEEIDGLPGRMGPPVQG